MAGFNPRTGAHISPRNMDGGQIDQKHQPPNSSPVGRNTFSGIRRVCSGKSPADRMAGSN